MGVEIRHPCLGEAGSIALADARLSDRERLAILLQGAAVLAHLDRAKAHLGAGWAAATLTRGGELRVADVRPGSAPTPVQDGLLELSELLFGARRVVGRGQAKAIVRRLAASWSSSLAPLPADRAIGRILDLAPFLASERYRAARRALAGYHREGQGWQPWFAGPPAWRRRALAALERGGDLDELFASGRFKTLWREAREEVPRRLYAARRWSAALAAWDGRSPRDAGERLLIARALFSLGRFREARKLLHGARSLPARVLRIRLAWALGELRSARDGLLRLKAEKLVEEDLIDVAEIAVRVFSNLGDTRRAAEWVARAQRVESRPLACRAWLIVAQEAWDREDTRAALAALEEARPLLAESAHAWRWHAAAGLVHAADPRAALGHLTQALAGHRRRLTRLEAAQLWNQVGICRARLSDLAGSERAFVHALRLLEACDGPRRTTLALFNLAEMRIRRGRLSGVRQILEEATAENRSAANVRGLLHDAEAWARLELAEGRMVAALTHCREALANEESSSVDGLRFRLHRLAARALGWLGRLDEAAEELEAAAREAGKAPPEAAGDLEPEELPGLYALAGQRDRALAASAQTPFASLWTSALAGRPAAAPEWTEVDTLEPFRAARLIFDLESVSRGSVPPERLRRAIAVFRRLGATALAERLEASDKGPWQAVSAFLETPHRDRLAVLFAQAGYPDVALRRYRRGVDEVLVAGSGGPRELKRRRGDEVWTLAARETDAALEALLALAVELSAPQPDASSPTLGPERGGLLGDSAELCRAIDRAAALAPADLPIMILGESGTGKERVARLVHRLSDRGQNAFVPVNCAALSESLVLSDLFGHVRGAFTGADRDRAGVFETAQGGTVFLDEIGDLPLPAQGLLLRTLQESEVRRVGESLPRPVDVRVVAATHRDLGEMVARGAFREDLLFRLRVAAIELPPLRRRGDDVLLLARHFLARQADKAPAGRGRPSAFSAAAESRLLGHEWPGNVRELKNVVEVAAALAAAAGSRRVESEHLEIVVVRPSGDGREPPASTYHQQVESLKRRLVIEAMEHSGGRQAAAARRLGLTRQALSYLLQQLDIS